MQYRKTDILVYIAGPYTTGPDGEAPVVNTREALKAADIVADAGYSVFIPHLFHFWEFVTPRHYSFWMELDERMLERCDAMLRLPGPSSGADEEEAFCDKNQIPAFHLSERDMEIGILPQDFIKAVLDGEIRPRYRPLRGLEDSEEPYLSVEELALAEK